MPSNLINPGLNAPHRALLKAVGVTDADMNKPFIAVVNSYAEIVPGHVHLQELGSWSKRPCGRPAAFPSSSTRLPWMTGSPWDTRACIFRCLRVG